MSTFYTRKGDNGSTGLLGEGRVMKFDLRMEVLGALDEVSAALGLARSLVTAPDLAEMILKIQRELYQLMAEVAASPENAQKFRGLNEEHVQWLEQQADYLSGLVNIPREFIVPGDSPSGAAISLARTIVRRAERRAVELWDEGLVPNEAVLAYLNRLSSLCFVMELREIQSAGKEKPTLAKEK